MLPISSAPHWARFDEAALLTSFDGLDRALRVDVPQSSLEATRTLHRALIDIANALGAHRRLLETIEQAPTGDKPAGAIPASIDRRRDKLFAELDEHIIRSRILSQLANATSAHYGRPHKHVELATIKREAEELLQAVRTAHAHEQALAIDDVTMEVGVGD